MQTLAIYTLFLKVHIQSFWRYPGLLCPSVSHFLTFFIASALPLLMGEQGSVLDPVFSPFSTWMLPMCSPGFSHQPESLCRGSQGYSSNQDPHRWCRLNVKYSPEDLWTLGLQLVDQHLWKSLKPLGPGELLAEVNDLGGILRFYSPAPLAVILFPD